MMRPPGEATVSPPSLTFTSLNWYAPRTVTVTGVPDLTRDRNQVYTILVDAATSADTASPIAPACRRRASQRS